METKQNESPTQLPRRTFLRGASTLLALPFFYSYPGRLAADILPKPRALAMTPEGNPLRLAFVYHPNGVIMENWRPKGATLQNLPRTLAPLEPLRQSLTVVSGLKHDKAFANGDGAGDHARATGTYLTGVQLKKTGGSDIRAGQSIDQRIAEHLRGQTPLPSLELSCSNKRTSGSCDSGYSCAYQFNMSWRNEKSPNTPEVNPRSAFARLFGGSNLNERKRMQVRWDRRQSVLDAVTDDARRLYRDISIEERGKLDAYLESVRAVEQRIAPIQEQSKLPDEVATVPQGIPRHFSEYLDTMYELMALAFQTDSTRVITFLQSHDGSGRKFPELGISDGHHQLSHHKNEAKKIEMLKDIDRFYTDAYARFLQRLANTQDGQSGSLLDSCLILYGGGICDGNRHNHDDLPLVIGGTGGGLLRGDTHETVNDVPMCNLFLNIADSMGTPVDRFGDSTGKLKLLKAS